MPFDIKNQFKCCSIQWTHFSMFAALSFARGQDIEKWGRGGRRSGGRGRGKGVEGGDRVQLSSDNHLFCFKACGQAYMFSSNAGQSLIQSQRR